MNAIRRVARSVLPDAMLSRLAMTREWIDLRSFRPYVVRRQFGDRELEVHITDSISQRWYDKNWTCPEEIELLSQRGKLQPGATVFDLGAHQAVVAMMLAERVEPTGRVIAVEPIAHNVETARLNLASNSVSDVELVHAAASDISGHVRITPRRNAQVVAATEAGVDVRAVTVDELAMTYGRPHVLFIDVEGFEIHVLRGAQRVLRDARPDLFLEVHSGVGLEHFGNADDVLALIPPDYAVLVSKTSPVSFERYVASDAQREILASHSLIVALAPGD